ncbi:MAG: Site-specific recombinase XerD [Rhodobacteraceae bacterium HLUCCA12]|nr:MAG: Site-specific recombinase XerD [Rhodobacteraceae bacterium HLUCCA12]
MSRKADYIHQRGKNGIWYARLRVPSDLVKAFGKNEFSKSLLTSDERAARKKARSVIADWERQFEEVRQKPDMSSADAETLARAYYIQHEQADLAERDHRPIAARRESSIEEAMRRIAARTRQMKDTTIDPFKMLDHALDEIGNFDLSGMAFETRRFRLRELRAHLARREYALITHEAEALIDELSLPITRRSASNPDEDTAEFITLCDRLMRAEIELLERQNERDRGDFGGKPRDPMLRRGNFRLDLTSFEAIIEEQEKRSNRGVGGKKASSTFRKYRSITKEFTEWRKSSRAATVTREEVERWRDELIDAEFAPKTVRDKVSCIKAVLTWGQAHSNRSLFPDGLPLDRFELPELDEQDSADRTYTIAQAETILIAARSQGASYKRWVPWILAYSGARISEILQLTKEDFFQVGDDWFYHIRHGGDRTTKTKKSRKVPVHPALVEEGLIDFVSARPAGTLFTDARMDGNLRDWIRDEVLPDLPSPRPGPNHGFRHLFEDLRLGAIESDAAKYIAGRANKNSSADYGKSLAMLPALARQMANFPRFLTAAMK